MRQLGLELGDARLGALERMLLDQRGLGQEIEGQRLLTAEPVNKLASFLVDLAQRGRPQALKEAEDQVAFLRGHDCLLLSRVRFERTWMESSFRFGGATPSVKPPHRTDARSSHAREDRGPQSR